MTDYMVFHDESKGERGEEFWHAFFWVPIAFLPELTGFLAFAYRNSGHMGDERSFKCLGHSQAAHRYANCWLTILKQSLQSCKPHLADPFDCGRTLRATSSRREPAYCRFTRLPCCKLSVFFLPNGLRELRLCRDETARFEATFLMGLKNGGHRLFSEFAPCRIAGIRLDRERHYQRPLDKALLLRRIAEEARDYLSLSPDCTIEGEALSEREQLVIDALDILLGSFRHAHAHGLSEATRPKARKRRLTMVTHDLLTRVDRGDGMRNSRYRDGYTLRRAWLEEGRWRFDDLHSAIIERVRPEDRQATLSFSFPA